MQIPASNFRSDRFHRLIGNCRTEVDEVGWLQYYGRFYRSALYPPMRQLDRSLARWADRKYKKLRRHLRRATHRKRAKLADIKKQLRQRMHAPLGETGKWLRSVVSGYFRYHAVPGNLRTLAGFRRVVSRLWLWTLRRRSQKRRMSWRRFYELENRYLPPPRTCHPFPNVRFAATHPR